MNTPLTPTIPPSDGAKEKCSPVRGVSDLRNLCLVQWEQLGRDSLREHLRAQAVVAHQKYAPLTDGNLNLLLQDPECLRLPVRLVFEFGEMAMHQFAQPDIDWQNQENNGRVLYLRPALQSKSDLLVYAVCYMIPVINYGEIISDEHCVLYGATLLGMLEEEFFTNVCAMADELGVETLSK